jgi:hypothetical protein
MLCALTVRRLKPGSFDDFLEAFMPDGQDRPPGWVSFTALRDGDRIVTFGMFDGTRDEMAASQVDHGYADRRAAADAFVEEVEVNGVFDVAHQMSAA